MKVGINDYLAGSKRDWSMTSHTLQKFRGIKGQSEVKQHSLEGHLEHYTSSSKSPDISQETQK